MVSEFLPLVAGLGLHQLPVCSPLGLLQICTESLHLLVKVSLPVAHAQWGTSGYACTVEHERNKSSDWLWGDGVTLHDQILQFDWLMMSHDHI